MTGGCDSGYLATDHDPRIAIVRWVLYSGRTGVFTRFLLLVLLAVILLQLNVFALSIFFFGRDNWT